MIRVSVCVDSVFHGWDFIKSIKAIDNIGIKAIEFWSWWDKDIEKLVNLKKELDIEISAFCTRMISLLEPSKGKDFKIGLKESIGVAHRLGCTSLIAQTGNEIIGISRESQYKNLIEGLKECAPILEDEGITLLVEPLNTSIDHIGYFLSRSEEAFRIIDEVDSPRVKILFDIYHQQITEGNLLNNIIPNIGKIGHFHGAGHPGRHELDKGEINYPYIFKAIGETEFKGYMGLEYFPIEDPLKGLVDVLSFLK